VALKKLLATDADRVAARDVKIDDLRELLRDVYDVLASGKSVSEGLLSRIRRQMAVGK